MDFINWAKAKVNLQGNPQPVQLSEIHPFEKATMDNHEFGDPIDDNHVVQHNGNTLEANWDRLADEWFGTPEVDYDPELEIRDVVLRELGFTECMSRHLGVGIKTKYLQERVIRDIKINPQLGRIDTLSCLNIIHKMTKDLDSTFPNRYRFEILIRNKKLAVERP